MPSKQVTFNRVYRHLLRQGRKAQAPKDGGKSQGCVLLAKNGDRCAAGCLVPKRILTSEWDTRQTAVRPERGVRTQLMRYLRDAGHDLELVAFLQNVHDSSRPELWAERLHAVAEYHELECPT